MNSFKNKLVALTLLISLTFSLYGCASYDFVNVLHDYDGFLSSRFIYSDTEPVPKPDPIFPDVVLDDIKGYKPLILNKFDFATNYLANYDFLVKENKKFIVDKKQVLTLCPLELANAEFVEDYAIFSKNNKYGVVKLPHFNEVLPFVYNEIIIKGSSFLAKDNEKSYIFENEKLITTIKTLNINILQEKVYLNDGVLVNGKLEPLEKDSFIAQFVDNDGNFIIRKDDLFGYYYKKKFILPQFYQANSFCNGYARVMLNKDTYAIINEDGKVVKASKNNIFNFHDGYFCYSFNNNIGVLNSKFEVVISPRFMSVAFNRVFGKFLLLRDGDYQFYNIESNTYGERYLEVAPFENHFICRDYNGVYSLLNENLEVLASGMQEVSIAGNVALVKKDNVFMYYEKI